MKYHATTILFLLIALVLYAIGAAVPATVFIALGIFAEALFWIRALRGFNRGGDT